MKFHLKVSRGLLEHVDRLLSLNCPLPDVFIFARCVGGEVRRCYVQEEVVPQNCGTAEALADRELAVVEQLAAHRVGLVPELFDVQFA